jgi:hypothetical protein
MRRALAAGVAVLMAAGIARADAPSKSPRPMPRTLLTEPAGPPAAVAAALSGNPSAAEETVTAPVQMVAPVVMTQRPKARPTGLGAVAATPEPPQVVMATASAMPVPERRSLFQMLRPSKRPEGLGDGAKLASARAAPVLPGKPGVVSKKGSVCGDPSIRGEALAPITSKTQGCGVPDPVKITSVAGVRLSQPATVDCDTARALKSWIERGLEPAYGKGRVVELQVAGHYICRTRNHRSGAKISEHGRGRAIDISGFTFSNGKTVMVQGNFDRTMRKAHKAACGIFNTTLGPGSDGMHEDHLHFDTARNRRGPYCR